MDAGPLSSAGVVTSPPEGRRPTIPTVVGPLPSAGVVTSPPEDRRPTSLIISGCTHPRLAEKGQAAPSPVVVLLLCLLCFVASARAALEGEGPVRSRPLIVAKGGKPGFARLDPSVTGLTFTNFVPESRHLTNQLLLDGGGVTAGDVDGDDRVDVFFAGMGGTSALWGNLGGFTFTNRTRAAFGADSPLATLDATGCAMADLNADGAVDLVVNSHGQGTYVFLNDGHGGFRALPPMNPGRGGHSIAIADVDGDGWLDLYIANYRVRALMDMPNARATFKVSQGRTEVATVDGRPVTAPDLTNRFTVNVRGGVEELGEPDVLYLNVGGTNFVEVPWTGGAWLDAEGQPLKTPPFEWGLAAQFRDLDSDGRPELYVCNDFQSPDRLWRNESKPGQVRFRLASPGTLRHTSRFSMGVDFADVNRDGHDDFLVLDMLSRDPVQRLTQLEDVAPSDGEQSDAAAAPQYDVNTLQMGRGDGSFFEAAAFAGVQASEWSWTPAFLDVDLDGWEDVLITTGQWRAARDLDVAAELRRMRQTRRLSDAELFAARRRYPRLEPAQVAFQNQGGRFRECAAEWGFDFHGVAQGLCLADLDNDGDLDVLVNHLNAVASVFRNESSAPRIAVRLLGDGGNRSGIGARIRVLPAVSDSAPVQSQEITAGGRYLSGDAPGRTFAAMGDAPWTIEVRWPDGRTSRMTNATLDRLYELQPTGPIRPAADVLVSSSMKPTFEEVSVRLSHTNVSEVFDEFGRQPLLPRRLATEGPGVAWADLDGDDREELVLPGGYQGALQVFRVLPGLRFALLTNSVTSRAQPMAVPWNGRVLVAESSYTDGTPHGAALSAWPGAGPALAAGPNAVGTLATADVEGDGPCEVFVGARVVPGQWPRNPASALVGLTTNGFEVRQVITNAGLVTAAVFVDLDLDGDVDLAVSSEWSEPRFFRNEAGRFSPWRWEFRVAETTLRPGTFDGLWTSVNAGDFDGDGAPDLVLGNWGENSYWEVFDRPWVAWHGDLDGDGTEDVFTGYARPGLPMPPDEPPSAFLPMLGLGVLSGSVPAIRERFRSHREFALANLEQVLGPRRSDLRRVSVQWVSSVVLLNRSNHWSILRLPDAAQMSPVFGTAVADWDGDGREDLFLTQNFFGQNHGITRDDAGLGVLLRGRGDGRFESIPAAVSGIRISGQGRAAAVADIDSDGRPDLVVTQHAGPTRVFRNVEGRQGLRVRLDAGPGNRLGAGASARWVGAGGAGPSRVWRFGAGHGASDSAVQVLARPLEGDGELQILWPGGKRSRVPVRAETHGVGVSMEGRVEELKP